MTAMPRNIVVIAHDMRSCHNVGSLLRTCEGLGVAHLYFTGYTPFPSYDGDTRLPHLAQKITKQIQKTALGSESMVPWTAGLSVEAVIDTLHKNGYSICALEQSPGSVSLPMFEPPSKVALLLGNEVTGIEADLLAKTDTCLEIPMFGDKESFNVVQAAAMALYHLVFWGRS